MGRFVLRHRHEPSDIQDADAEGFRPLIMDDGEMSELDDGEALDCQLTGDVAFVAGVLERLIVRLVNEGMDLGDLFADTERLRTIAE